MNKRKSFILHIDSLAVIDDLSDEQCGQLLRAIKAHQLCEGITLSGIVNIAFSPFKNQFIRDNEKYETTCKRRAEAGSMGGKQKVANASKRRQKVANVADSDNKSKNKSKSDKDKEENKQKKKAVAFIRPSEDDLKNYAMEAKLNIDGMYDFYQSNGWKVGRNSMKDWKATARNWSARQTKGYGNATHKQNNRQDRQSAYLDELANA